MRARLAAVVLLGVFSAAMACRRKPASAEEPASAAAVRIPQELDGASVDPDGPTVLDGKSLDEIADFRRRRVAAHARLGLFREPYEPFDGPGRAIYGSITPGRRWLGPTPYYVANPYALIVAVCANHVTPLSLTCPGAEVMASAERIHERYEGEAARCWRQRCFDGSYASDGGTLRLVMVNAFDAGLGYAHVDLDRSSNVRNVTPGGVGEGVFSQPSLYHVGRYGANNISPEDARGWLRLEDRDAATRIWVKLWRSAPRTTRADADVTYLIDVRGMGS